MKKAIAFLIPAVVIVLFIVIMLSAPYLKKPFGENDDVVAIIAEIKQDVNNGDWSEAKDGAEQLENAWDIITERVQFSVEREELKDGKKSITRLKGFLEASDRSNSLAELGEVNEQWKSIGEWE